MNTQQINYNSVLAQQTFSFIDPSFKPASTKEKIIFCPKELRPLVQKFMNNHLHQHPLIPTADGQFLSSNSIWTMAVEEAYNFCKKHSLPWLWSYLWNEWYGPADCWYLWFRAGCSNKISIFKTNMFVEAHWKVIKRDFLYEFFCPRLDLVVFIISNYLQLNGKRLTGECRTIKKIFRIFMLYHLIAFMLYENGISVVCTQIYLSRARILFLFPNVPKCSNRKYFSQLQ